MTAFRILVAEDNPANMRLTRKLLEHRGHVVVEATSIEEARAKLEKEIPDLLLLDIMLPGGGGESLLEEIRQSEALRTLPVIAVTALAMAGDRDRLMGAGFDGYISKPLDTRSFGPEVDTYLARRKEATRKKILVLHDDRSFRDLVFPLLSEKGYRVLWAQSGAEADDLVRSQDLDLAIVDSRLPDVTGSGWISALRARGHKLKTIVVSSYWSDFEGLRSLLRALDVVTVIQKPIIPSVFSDLVEHYLAEPTKSPAIASAEADLATLRLEYARELPGRVRQLAHAIHEARARPLDEFLRNEAKTQVHNLVGTAGSYGFAELGERLATIDAIFRRSQQAKCAVSPEQWSEIAEAIDAVDKAPAALPSGRAPVVGTNGRVLLVDDDPDALRCLITLTQGQLLEVVPARGFAEAIEKASATPPDVAVLDVLLEGSQTGFDLARELRTLPDCGALPFAFVTGDKSLSTRISATHIGGVAFLPKPTDLQVLRGALKDLLAVRNAEKPNILVVDDDPVFCDLIRAMLAQLGMRVTTLHDATRVLEVLGETRHDVVLLDVIMPGLSGYDVCRLLRTTPQWRELPVVFLTVRAAASTRFAAFQAGGDDCLAKPVVTEQLREKIDALVQRSRLARDRAEKDTLTGLLLRRVFLERFSHCLSEAQRQSRALVVALLDVDHFKSVNDKHGHLAGDRVLAALGSLLSSRFRAQDLRGRWEGEEFVLAFPDEDAQIIEGVLLRTLEELSALPFAGEKGATFHVTFSAGIASFPKSGASAETLFSAAAERLETAKTTGRGRIAGEGDRR
jgi:diguanylate cyclase (GGDEF)-like protein